ncbi:MAG: hypothetical protein U0441_10860 [Polyangiaceae bacterium]
MLRITSLRNRHSALALFALVALAGGCQLIAGIGGEEPLGKGGGGTGGSTTTGGGGNTLPTGTCSPDATQPCYTGADGTEGTGLCKGGVQTCGADGMWGATCDGEVVPALEDCASSDDENCDGHDCAVWAKMFDTNVSSGAIGIDGQGNIYAGVGFSVGVDFGDGKPVVPVGSNDMAILAYDKTGKLLWVKAFPQSGSQALGFMSVDSEGHIAIGGSTDTDMNLGLGNIPAGQFVAKLDNKGQLLWGVGIGGQSYISAVALDSKGNVFVGGAGTSVDVGKGLLDGGDTGNFWIAKLGFANGLAEWAKITKGGKNEALYGMAVDPSDSIVLTGSWDGQYLGLSGDAGIPNDVYNCCGGAAPFLVRLDPNGNLSNYKMLAGYSPPITVYMNAIANDPLGTSMLAGSFSGKVDFQSGNYDAGMDTGMFVLRDQTSGFQQTGTFFVQSGVYASPSYVGLDSKQNVVMQGFYSGPLDFGGGPLPVTDSRFVVKLDKTGKYLWSRTYDFGDGGFNGMAVGTLEDETALIGNFYGGIDLGLGPVPGSGTFILRLGK